MPVLDVRVPDPDEFDLPEQRVPAVLAGALHELADLARVGNGWKYIGCQVVSSATDFVTLKDNTGHTYTISGGQSADCDFFPGVTWLGLVPNSNIAAGEVRLIPRVRVGPSRGGVRSA